MPGAAVRVILCVAAAAAWTRPVLAQTGRPDIPHTERFRMLTPCAANAGVLCGSLEVPENRSTSGGRKIRLSVAVVPALDAAPAPDPLFAVTGGGPGVASVPDAPNWPRAYPRLRQTRDIVFVDQRGTGGSNPLDCPIGDAVAAVKALIGGEMSSALISGCRDRLAATADLAAYTTAAAADDLDDVRRWLGFDRINVYGASYATRLALAYAQRYPQYVRSITVKSPMPAALRNPLNTAADSQAALERVFADCRAEAACSAAFPTLRQDFESVLARLSKEPGQVALRNGPTIDLTRGIFAGVIRRMLYGADTQRAIPLTIAAAARGDYTALAPVLSAGEALDRALNTGLFLSVTCAEDVSRYDQSAVKKATAGTFSGDSLATPLLAACRNWPRTRVGQVLDRPVRGNVPALIISGALDPQTPPRWGREMAKLLPGARTIEADGLAHTGTPPCLAGLVESFVLSGSAASLDTSCVKDLRREPFTLPKP